MFLSFFYCMYPSKQIQNKLNSVLVEGIYPVVRNGI